MTSLLVSRELLAHLIVYCGTALILVRGQSFELSYSIDEELPINTSVGNVGKDSKISQLLSGEDYSTLKYRILHVSEGHNNFFSIVNTTGVIKTAAIIDREAICFYETMCKLNLHVAAQTESGQQFYTFKVTVFILDVNDNSPTFSLASMNMKIDEDVALHTSFPINSATDRDILNNTLQRYTLLTASETFGIKVTRNLDDSLTPQLWVKGPLDRERQPHYFLKVLALDGGQPRRSGELTINVTLNDVNDNAPRFSKQIYDESVPETSHIGHRVMTLSATDEDLGNNGRVTFRLGARQSEEAFNTFRVVANTGDVMTLRDLTPLQGQTLKLVVEAVDQGSKSQTAQAVVNIHVIDSINNPPVIRMTIPPGSLVSRIVENASPGFVVAHFMVEDADSGENGLVSCHLKDDTFGLQRLKDSEYKVTVYNNLDRERVPYYDVTITCMDGGSPAMTTTVVFKVILEDANDNPPKFIRTLYRANITENQNSFIVKIEAEDIDLGQNGSVSYKLGDVTSLVAAYIQVNPQTGEVRTRQMLDYELFKHLDFPVVALDAGTPSLSSTARVIVDVADVNDNMPRVPNGYYLSVPENRPAGTLIGQVQAVDPDEGLGGKVGYQLRSDNDATKLFNLSQSGELRTLKMFDRETKNVYDIDILAWDHGVQPQTNDLRVRILISDVNDHAPVFDFPRLNNKTVHTTLDSRHNSTVTTILASDQDSGENASLTYTVVDGGRGVFDVDPHTGRLFTVRNLHTKDKGTYTVSLFVRDNGAQPLSATSTIVVVVTQGNGTAALASFGTNEHIVIVAILVGITIFIAIVVFLIVIRFLKKGGRHRRTKYTGGLPVDAKLRTPITEDHGSSDEEPWKNYDSAKRPNGPVMSGDVVYEVNDDIILFKLKLADQYKELEPEDKDPCCGAQHDDEGSRRNSVNSDMDGAPEMPRDRSMNRLATFHNRPTVVQASSYGGNPDPKEKVWRTGFKDEIMSSCSRETNGADSGRGPSEDGSSSVTDDSGCLISPSHSLLRGNPTKHQGNYSRPTSGSGYDRPQMLMTFQTTDFNGSHGTRQDYSPNNPFPPSLSPRQFNGYGNDYSQHASTEKLQIGDWEFTIHRNKADQSPDKDNKNTGHKKMFSSGTSSGGNKRPSHKSKSGSRKDLTGVERLVYQAGKSMDIRLCSEPPNVARGEKAYNKRGVQETGMSPPGALSPNAMHASTGRLVYVESYLDRSPGSKQRFVYPSPSFYLQTANPNNFKQASCPQLYEEANFFDPYSQITIPMTNRSRSFHSNEMAFGMPTSRSFHNSGLTLAVPSRSVHDMRLESMENQDDGNTTTTSGSFTIDHEELAGEMPHQADAFV